MMAVLGASPLISVIIPTLNRSHHLLRALGSVLMQTLQRFEVVVVDDGSVVPTVLPARLAADPRIRLVRLRATEGAAAARNTGIAAARAPWIAFLDDDDEFLADYLGRTLAAWQTAPRSAALAWTGVQRIFANRTIRCEARADQDESLERFLTIGCGFGISMPTQLLRRLGGFDTALRLVEDTDLFLRLLVGGYRPMVIPGVHVKIHEHLGPRLTSQGNAELRQRECAMLLERYGDFFRRRPTLEAHVRRHIQPTRQHFVW
jgi:glycosyltransferase involved in cell wall biosynthesis